MHYRPHKATAPPWARPRCLALSPLLAFVALFAVSPALASAAVGGHAFSSSFGTAASTPANPYPLSEPTDVAVDNSSGSSAGYVYVTDTANHRVEKFGPSGQFLLMFGSEVNKTAVEDHGSTEEQDLCTEASGDECQSGTEGSAPGAFESPTFVAVDGSSGLSAGDVYVGDTGDDLVSKFDPQGHLIASWGNNGEGPHKNGPPDGQLNGSPTETFEPLAGIAVDDLGDLFVYGAPEAGTVAPMLRFEQSGHFLEGFVTPEETRGNSHIIAPVGIAVDSEDNTYTAITPEGGVEKFNAVGRRLGQESALEGTTGLATDPDTGDLYVDQGGASIYHFLAGCPVAIEVNFFNSGCGSADQFGSEPGPGQLTGARGLAYGASSKDVYVADTGANRVETFTPFYLPTVALEEPTSLQPSSLTLNGEVKPEGGEEVIGCRFEYGYTTAYSLGSLPCSQTHFSAPTHVSANLTDLAQGVHYHYRLVAQDEHAESHTPDAQVSPAQAPTIEGTISTEVTQTTAELSTKVDPQGRETTYRFEYGTTTAYGNSAPNPPEGESLGSGSAPERRSVQLTGLQPGTTYHYRVVAQNEYGTTTTEDHTFGFYPSPCPNEALRQQSGSAGLPDCRAYELVSPAEAGSVLLFPSDGPSSGQAAAPSRLAYVGAWGLVPDSGGEPSNSTGDLYVATRTDQGWVTKYVGLPSEQAYRTGGPPWANTDAIYSPDYSQWGVLADPSLSRIVDWNDGHWPFPGGGSLGEGPGTDSSEAPYVWDSTTGVLDERWPTDLLSVPDAEEFKGETAASEDLSHFVFSSNFRFVKGAAPGDVYDDDTATDRVAVASLRPGSGESFAAQPLKVSSDGSRILITVGGGLCTGITQEAPSCGAGQLYMRVDDAATYEIAPGHALNYIGMTADGSKVFFTSAEQLTAEETDGNTELYMWEAAKAENHEEPLTLISKPNGGVDNTESCDASWAENCDAVPISFSSYATLQGGLGGNGHSDTYIASENGDIYFYSPQQLDGDRGILGQQNLYVYRGGQVQLVSTLSPGGACGGSTFEIICSAGPVARMDVSPDDTHMAFITPSQLTGYDNAGHTEMYSYTPTTGQIVCDSCIPNGSPPTSEVYGSQNGLFMTNDGRTFFSTIDALVPQDTNQATDVYEYVDGHPQLITPGTGELPLSTKESSVRRPFPVSSASAPTAPTSTSAPPTSSSART